MKKKSWVFYFNIQIMLSRFIYLLILITAYQNSIAQSSSDRVAEFKNYGQYLEGYLKPIHDLNYQKQLAFYKKDFELEATFKIDLNGKIISLDIKNKEIPDSIVQYIFQLIRRTDGGWLPQLKDCQPVVSDTIHCYFLIRSKAVSMQERWELSAKEVEVMLTDPAYVLKESIWKNYEKINYCFIHLEI